MVNLNVLEERLEDVNTFQKVLDVTLSILMDETGDFMKKFGIRGTPYNVFINKEGVIKEIVHGGMTMEMLENSINNIN